MLSLAQCAPHLCPGGPHAILEA
jgi:hypothetical protein